MGSNQNPEFNIKLAKKRISETFQVLKWSSFCVTEAVSELPQKPFLNGVVLIETEKPLPEMQAQLKSIEDIHHRDRQDPLLVTLDLDILMWNGAVVHDDVTEKEYLKEMILEVCPDYKVSPPSIK